MTVKVPAKMLWVAIVVLSLVVGGSAGAATYRYGPYAAVKRQLGQAQGAIAVLESRVAAAKGIIKKKDERIEILKHDLTKTRSELDVQRTQAKRYAERLDLTEAQLQTAQAQLSHARRQLRQTGDQLGQTQSQLKSVEGELSRMQGQLAQTEEELGTEKRKSRVYLQLSLETLRNYCRSIDNEVLLARNSLNALRRVELWMEVVEVQVRLPSEIWSQHRENVTVAESNLASAEEEQRRMRSLCQAIR
jgi:chromosome segregation ATPase